MGRKVFLSFLGTNPYVPCRYGGSDETTAFIQEALVKRHCMDWSEADRIFIFLTKDAVEKNWKDGGNFDLGLESILAKMDLKAEIVPVRNVPAGKSEEEIWDIFHVMYSCLEVNDVITYDITHSFRSLPMLGMALLNYAKFLKNISVDSICYGAFEVLGSPREVKEMPEEERNAPIFDLTAFSAIQDWSVAADNFVTFGNSGKLKSVIGQKINPILRETRGKDEISAKLRSFSDSIETVTKVFSTCRGNHLLEGTVFNTLRTRVDEIKADAFPPLAPLLEKIEKKIEGFEENCVMNGFKAVEWCVDHNLVQQGITMLQEVLITYVLTELKKDTKSVDNREVVSSAFYIKSYSLPEQKWNKKCQDNKELVRHAFKFDDIRKVYDSLRNYRNNINHGGFCDNWNSEKFSKQLKSKYQEVIKIIKTRNND